MGIESARVKSREGVNLRYHTAVKKWGRKILVGIFMVRELFAIWGISLLETGLLLFFGQDFSPRYNTCMFAHIRSPIYLTSVQVRIQEPDGSTGTRGRGKVLGLTRVSYRGVCIGVKQWQNRANLLENASTATRYYPSIWDLESLRKYPTNPNLILKVITLGQQNCPNTLPLPEYSTRHAVADQGGREVWFLAPIRYQACFLCLSIRNRYGRGGERTDSYPSLIPISCQLP